jgi:hypothetical protein
MVTTELRFVMSVVAVFVLLAWICLNAAGTVAVSRDGNLVFSTPDNSSAVMDILSCGTVLEPVEEGNEWDKVRVPGNGGEGYIRVDSVSSTAVPGAINPGSMRVGSPQYLKLQSSMDEAGVRMRQIAGILESLERNLVQADSMREAVLVGSRPRAGTTAGGGMMYRKYSSSGIAKFTTNNVIASTRSGVLIRLAGPVAIKVDTRYIRKFAEPKTEGDSRVYLGASLLR